MVIRSARETDIPAMQALITQNRAYFPALSMAGLAPVFSRNIHRGSAIVAARDVRVCGLALWSPVLRRISLIAVSPEQQGKGIATALMENMLCHFPEGAVYVETFRPEHPLGTAALALYRKFGFVHTEDIDGFSVPMQRLKLQRK